MNLTMRYQHKNYCCPKDQILTSPKKSRKVDDMLFFKLGRAYIVHHLGVLPGTKTSANSNRLKGCMKNNPSIQVNLDIWMFPKIVVPPNHPF